MSSSSSPFVADHERAIEVVETLMAADFQEVISLLGACLKAFEADDDQNGVLTMRALSRLLLPWLYVVSNGMQPGRRLAADPMTGFVKLPAGLESFAEIAQAGIECRATAFRAGWDEFPPGEYLASDKAPGGIGQPLDASIRAELFRIAKPPGLAWNLDEAGQDKAINIQLEFMRKNGIQPYFIIPFAKHRYDQKKRDAELAKLRERYENLILIDLDYGLFHANQAMFNDIRDLLLPEA